MLTLQDVVWERDLIPYLHVELLDVDITADVLSERDNGIAGIENILDYPELNNFKASNIILTLSNGDGRFSPDNPANFFIRNGDVNVANSLKADGFGAKVTVDIGKVVAGKAVSRRIFVGTVVDLELVAKPARVKLTCVDGQQSLREAVVQDFGIDRWLVTLPVENSLPWGTYRVPAFMTPVSEESVVATKVDGNELTNVEQIRTEGRIRADAYGIKHERGEVRTEGGRLSAPPRMKFREQYRWRFVDSLVREILTHTGTMAGTIRIPRYRADERVMSTHGRVGWHTEWRQGGRTSASEAGWTGYAKDFVFKSDGTEAVFVYGGEGTQHALLHYDFELDRWTTLYEPAKPIELWRVASTDFDDIYVLGSATGVYDALTGGDIKIWRYKRSTGVWSVVSESGAGDPQLASPYHFGTPDRSKHAKLSIFPDTRHLFEAVGTNVFYRKANTSRLGIRSIVSDYDLDFVHPPVKDLNYAYDGFVSGQYLYLVYISGTLNQRLKVERQLISSPGGSVSTVIDIPLSNTYFYFGVSNIVADGSDGFWCVLQKGLPRQGFGSPIPGFLGEGKHYPGIGELVYVDFTASTRRVLYTNNYASGAMGGVRLGAGLGLYFLGGIYHHDSPFLDEEPGNLLEVTKTEALVTQRSWTSFFVDEARLLDRCISPFRQRGESTFFVVGFDVPERSLGFSVGESVNAQSPQNWLWQEISEEVSLKLPVLSTHRRRVWDVLTELATITHTTIGFEQDSFTMRTRDAVRTRLTHDVLAADVVLQVEGTESFPGSGYLLVRQEVIAYSGKTGDRFTGVVRGVHGSDVSGYGPGAEVILVDGFAFDHAVDSNLISVNLEPDFLNLYNQVTVRYGDDNRAYVEDEASVSVYGERPYELELANLSEHERDWAKRLAESYLEETSKIRSLVSLVLRWSPELEIGEIIVVHHEDNIHLDWVPCRVLRLYHDVANWETRVTAKEIPRRDLVAPEIGDILLPRLRVGEYFRYRISVTGVPAPTFSLSGIPAGLSLGSGTGEISGTPTTSGESFETLTVTNSEGSDRKNIIFDVRPVSSYPTLTFSGVSLPTVIVIKQGCYVDMVFPEAVGGKKPVFYELLGIPGTMRFDSGTRRLTGISRVVGDVAIYYSCVDSAVPEQSVVYAASVDLKTESVGEWSGLLLYDDSSTVGVTEYKVQLIDSRTNFARQYDVGTGAREVLDFADIYLGVGDWRGCVVTSDRKIFVDNAGNRAVFYDLDNNLQASEEISLGVGDWQDVCYVTAERIGFLDRDTGAVRVYDAGMRTRVGSADIVFGFDAEFRSIAPSADWSKLFVLVENLGALLVWSGNKMEAGNTLTVVGGTRDWQSVTLHPDGHLLVLQKGATRVIAISESGNRDTTKDIVLR